MAGKRVTWLDSTRGFAMFFVILGHVHSLNSTAIQLIYAFHMPLFFMISGATFRVGKYRSLGQCALDKARKLLVPYLMLYLVNIPLWYVNKKILGNSKSDAWDLVRGLVFANQDLGTLSQGALWFLPTLFLVSVLFWALAKLDERGWFKLVWSVPLLFVLGSLLSIFCREPTAWHVAVVPMATVFYWFGYVFMRHYEGAFDKLRLNRSMALFVLAAVLLLAVGVLAGLTNPKISMHGNSYHNIALMLVSSLGISLGLTMLLMKLPTVWPLDFAGKNSMVFLGFHIPILRFLENFGLTSALAATYPLLTALVVFALLIPVTWVVNKCFPFLIGKWYRPKKAPADSAGTAK